MVSAIRWSDQWNDLQGWRGTAEYYLRLEATNRYTLLLIVWLSFPLNLLLISFRGDNGSYCLFTVQFIVRIHGIRPSPLHSVITLLVSVWGSVAMHNTLFYIQVCVAVFYTILFIGFAIWLLCKRGKNPKEISKQWSMISWISSPCNHLATPF